MKIGLVGALPGRVHQGSVSWRGHEVRVIPIRFHDFARFLSPRRDRLVVDRTRLAALCDGAREVDVVVTESPETLALHHELRRRGERPPGLLSLDVRSLTRVAPLRAWYREHHRVDPWPALTTDPRVRWFVNSPALVSPLRKGGVRADWIDVFPSSTAVFAMTFPEADHALDAPPAPGGSSPADGAVLVAGSAERDHDLALQVARLRPDLRFVVLSERQVPSGTPANLHVLPPVPVERYIALMKRARTILVPLRPGPVAAGQLTVCLAHRVGTPLVCTDVSGVADYVTARDTVLVPPDAPEATAAALAALNEDDARREAIVAAGRTAEARRVEAFEDGLTRVIAAVMETGAA